MSVAGYFLSVLFCLLSMLISDSRFDLVWFRLSCDHGWIRSGSVNVRKQQQQQQLARLIPTRAGRSLRGRVNFIMHVTRIWTCQCRTMCAIYQNYRIATRSSLMRHERTISPKQMDFSKFPVGQGKVRCKGLPHLPRIPLILSLKQTLLRWNLSTPHRQSRHLTYNSWLGEKSSMTGRSLPS